MIGLRVLETIDQRASSARIARAQKIKLYKINTGMDELALSIIIYTKKLTQAPSEFEEMWLLGQIEINEKIISAKYKKAKRMGPKIMSKSIFMKELLDKAEKDYLLLK